jgi:hypothetical protein
MPTTKIAGSLGCQKAGTDDSQAWLHSRSPFQTYKSQATSGIVCSRPDIGTSNLTVSNVATISMTSAPATDQQRVLPGDSFRAAENFSLPKFHKAVAQLAASHPHC